MNVALCIGCGCDDEHACLDTTTGQGCTWLRVDRETGWGVCSVCTDHIARWDAGDTHPSEAALEVNEERHREWISPDDEDEPSLLLPGDFGYDETLRNLRGG